MKKHTIFKIYISKHLFFFEHLIILFILFKFNFVYIIYTIIFLKFMFFNFTTMMFELNNIIFNRPIIVYTH